MFVKKRKERDLCFIASRSLELFDAPCADAGDDSRGEVLYLVFMLMAVLIILNVYRGYLSDQTIPNDSNDSDYKVLNEQKLTFGLGIRTIRRFYRLSIL